MIDLIQLESSVMNKLLDGNHPVLEALRAQARSATIEERKQTGAGFSIKFKLPKDAVRAPMQDGRFHIGDVEATISGLKNGAGFVLFISDGKIDMLEGYSYEENWPETIDILELRYKYPNREELLNTFK